MSDNAFADKPQTYVRQLLNLWWIPLLVALEQTAEAADNQKPYPFVVIYILLATSLVMAAADYWWFVRKGRGNIMAAETLIIFGALAVLIGVGVLLFKGTSPTTSHTQEAAQVYVPSQVKLQFYSGNKWPTSISNENISWYALRNTFQVKEIDVASKKETNRDYASWNLFISFDKPTVYGQLTVDGNGVSLPNWEVKVNNNRYAVIHFNGDLSNLVLTVAAVK